MVRAFSGVAISWWYFLTNFAHSSGELAPWPSFIVSTLGARFGNHTSYQFSEANFAFGTPRGVPAHGADARALAGSARGAESNDADDHLDWAEIVRREIPWNSPTRVFREIRPAKGRTEVAFESAHR